jgi:hypothetical protein
LSFGVLWKTIGVSLWEGSKGWWWRIRVLALLLFILLLSLYCLLRSAALYFYAIANITFSEWGTLVKEYRYDLMLKGSPFSLGKLENFKEVFGYHPFDFRSYLPLFISFERTLPFA